MAKQHKFYAVVVPGLERIAARELKSLAAHEITIEYGGIQFSGTLELLYRVNLRARTITRVLMRLRTFRSMTLDGLGYDLKKVAWHLFFNENTTLDIEVHSHRSRLNHSDDIADFAKAYIQKLLPKLGTGKKQQSQTLHIRLDNNRGVLSLDTSGERLDRRGYRSDPGKAPLRETIAAAMLQWSGWRPQQTLLVPMCGSGTLAIEAALIGKNVAPNLQHDFACLHYPSFNAKTFDKVRAKTQKMKNLKKTLPIYTSDIHPAATARCASNAKRAGVEESIKIDQLDIQQLQRPKAPFGGVVMLNPPYALRLGEKEKTLSLWFELGHVIKSQFIEYKAWKTIIVCPNSDCEKALQLPIKKRLKFKHGGLDVTLLQI